MEQINRRDFLKASSAVAAALGLHGAGFMGTDEAFAKEGTQSVIWLQAQACSGDSVSLLNSIYYMTVDKLLMNTVDLNYHPTLMAGAGEQAIAAATAAKNAKGYVLVVEGAIPTGDSGRYCYLWPGTTALDGVKAYAANAAFVLAVGTCACYGGVTAGLPNPTAAKGVKDIGTGKTIINLPGCPTHPDWIVGTIAYILKNGAAPALDSSGRPTDYYARSVHSQCPYEEYFEDGPHAAKPGDAGCLRKIGCRGPETRADCPYRKWNSGAASTTGATWCITSHIPCHGCTESNFPDGKSPFFQAMPTD